MFGFYNNDALLRQMIEKASENHNNPYFAKSKIIDIPKNPEVLKSAEHVKPPEPKKEEKEIKQEENEPKPKPKRKPTARKIPLTKTTNKFKNELTPEQIIELYNKLNISVKESKKKREVSESSESEKSSESEEEPKIVKRGRPKGKKNNNKNKKIENDD